jgi:hypothetical protein
MRDSHGSIGLAATIVILVAGCGGGGGDVLDADVSDDAPSGPRRLSTTGLYEPGGAISSGLRTFTPTYTLWSDGAVKTRWLYLPPGTAIDTTDPRHWQLPVGAKLWKQFAAPDGRKLETRLIERVAETGSDDLDYEAGAFVWLDDESDAVLAVEGAADVRGTEHDVPTAVQCRTCHTGEPGFMLGVSTLQLSGDGPGERLADLDADGVLGATPPAPYTVPGDEITRVALGYLHANCGHCHNPNGSARPDVDLELQLDLEAATPADTTIWRTAVGVATMRFVHPGIDLRIAPGDPDASAVFYRMSVRDTAAGGTEQMPPFATEVADETGVAAVRTWIASLSP